MKRLQTLYKAQALNQYHQAPLFVLLLCTNLVNTCSNSSSGIPIPLYYYIDNGAILISH
eukprot:UN05690